jgi:cytochrome c
VRTFAVAASAAAALGACSTGEAPAPTPAAAAGSTSAAQCPQPRTTEQAPQSYYEKKNPLPATADNIERGRQLYERDAQPLPCAACHGINGDGSGPAGRRLDPPPRNFRCAETMNALPDGQLYWAIEGGSRPFHVPELQGALEVERPGRSTPFTAMRGYSEFLSETEIWQLVLYIRTLAR